MKKAARMTNNDKAAARVAAAIASGEVLVAHDALGRCDASCGPYRTATGDLQQQFAILSHGSRLATTARAFEGLDCFYATALDAAYGFVGRVGSTRAREAAIKAVGQ